MLLNCTASENSVLKKGNDFITKKKKTIWFLNISFVLYIYISDFYIYVAILCKLFCKSTQRGEIHFFKAVARMSSNVFLVNDPQLMMKNFYKNLFKHVDSRPNPHNFC